MRNQQKVSDTIFKSSGRKTEEGVNAKSLLAADSLRKSPLRVELGAGETLGKCSESKRRKHLFAHKPERDKCLGPLVAW